MAERLQPVLSRIDALKRQLYDALTNPRDYASMLGGRIQESGQAAKQLQGQAFADPRQPFKVTDEAALRQLTDMMMAGPLGFAPAGITAYHGSPYLFKQFDPMKVGTGEGAQAYGVGAGYTAEARPVAEGYRQALTKDRFATQSGIFEPSSLEHLNVKAVFRRDGLEKAIETAKKYSTPDSDYPEVAAKAARDLQVLESIKQSGGVQPIQGYLYKGDIPDEILPRFLDWDKPLSEQSKEVKDALAKLPHRGENWTFKDTIETLDAAPNLRDDVALNPTGQQIYNMLGSSNMVGNKSQGQAEATNLLNSLGIRGIKYADEASRGKYKAQTTYKGKPYSDVLTFYDKKQLDDFVKQKEAEGFGVKTFDQTFNFVPFRPEDFKIQEINDISLEEYIAKGLLSP